MPGSRDKCPFLQDERIAFILQKTAFGMTKAHLLMPILVLTLRLGCAFVHLFVNLLMAER